MRILALESSAAPASAAILEDGVVIASAWQKTGLTHSQTLLPLAENLMKTAALTFSDIDVFAVAKGPGSFTGLRIGLAAVKGLAMAVGKPCCGVSTLEGMYRTLLDGMRSVLKPEAVAVCAMDARVQQVYNANFDLSNGERLCADRAVSLKELADELCAMKRPVILIGDGAHLVAETLKTREDAPEATLLPEPWRYQSAVGTAIAAYRMGEAQLTEAGALTPEYLRLPQAERERLARLAAEKQ